LDRPLANLRFRFLFRISGEDVRLMLWDTAGQEEFDAITKAYYRGAQACVIAFSTVDRVSDNRTIYFSIFFQAFV
jgi:GTPase SAR1 family protein